MNRNPTRFLALLLLLSLPLGMGNACNETPTDDDDAASQDSQHPSHDPPKDGTGDKDLP
jgi:hypothetical protein